MYVSLSIPKIVRASSSLCINNPLRLCSVEQTVRSDILPECHGTEDPRKQSQNGPQSQSKYLDQDLEEYQ